jgi:hypothetical protein
MNQRDVMATQSDILAVFPLNHIDELFNAPSSDPFSTHEVDILGQSAMDCIANRVTRLWPRRPKTVHMTLQLPADQITPDLTEDTRTAIQRYCADRIESNQLQRGIVIQNSRRQFLGAMIGLLAALVVIALLVINPFGLLPDLLRTILVALAFLAGGVLAFGSLGSIIFDWVPFVQDTTVYRVLREMELTVESQSGEKRD